MKKYLLTTVIIFFASLFALNAQDHEKKKVHLKIIKEENGEVTEIDTVFEGTDKEGMYFLGDIDGMDVNIDSILKEFNIEGHEGMKFIKVSDKYHSKDSLKRVWHTIDKDIEGDSVKMKKMIFISGDCDKDMIKSKENMVFISDDCDDVIKEHIILNGNGGKVKVIKGEGGKSMVWTSKDESNINIEDHDGLKVIKITENIHADDSIKQVWHTYDVDLEEDSVKMKKMIFISEDGGEKFIESKDGDVIIFKTGDETIDILKSESGDKTIVKKVMVEKSGDKEKTIKIIVTEDGDHSIVKIEGDEDDLQNVEEKVKIYKYKTDDGEITVKAEIDIEEDNEKIVKKEFKKIKIYPNPTDGIFNLEFELNNKENVVVKVNNESGKSVYSKKVKKFSGKFSGEIDITKEEPGTYYILIKQGDKIIENKIEKK